MTPSSRFSLRGLHTLKLWALTWAAGLAMLPAAVLAAAPAASSASPDASLLYLQGLDQRIIDISWRLAASNRELCPIQMSGIGVAIHDAAQYAPAFRRAAIVTFGFGDGLPAILAIAKGGPADIAGIRQGDRLQAIDGEPFPAASQSVTAKEDYASIDAAMERLERLPSGRAIRVEILRGATPLELMVKPAAICASRVEVVPGGAINAGSNGHVVQIYGKLALWTRNDDELAIIIAHEMAHNALDHNHKIEAGRIDTGIFAGFGRNGKKLRDFEREADRYGLYMAARAGYDYRTAPELWRRLSATAGLAAIWATTHPSGRDRTAFNTGVVAEIADKQAAGAPMIP